MHRIDEKTIKTHTLELQRFLNLHRRLKYGSLVPQLKEDGIYGQRTETALEDYLEDFDTTTFGVNKTKVNGKPYWTMISDKLLDIAKTAETHIGERELPANTGFAKRTFANLMNMVGFQRGHAWCAYFVEAVYRQVLDPQMKRGSACDKIFSASTQTLLANFGKHPSFIITPDNIKYSGIEYTAPAGCIAFWQSRNKPSLGHVGIKSVDQDTVHHTSLRTIDGNTNDGGSREGDRVAKKTRNIAATTGSLRFQCLVFGDFGELIS